MTKKVLLISYLLLLATFTLTAQEANQAYLDAKAAYEIGDFHKVEASLEGKMETLNKQDQILAYRLLTLSCIYQDRLEDADKYAAMLLNLDPFYTAYSDSPRFADILERLKKGSSTITTASKVAETVEEVPVPVTLITEDMIRASGSTKLQDILKLYVPGLSEISGMDSNAAMRGVYGLSQETMLVLLDGHRLNSQTTNGEPLDFRNSVEKIKQIEVLRGPASSLYGNVALTAVINIITKKGGELDGAELAGLAGSNNTFGGTFMIGNGNLQFDYMAWASIYSSKGEEHNISGCPRYIEGYNSKPTYDFGANIRWGETKISFTMQHGHAVPYYNLINLSDKFTYDKYGLNDGEGPGFSRTNMRGDVEWSHTWKNFTLGLSGFGAYERQQIYNVVGDTVPYMIMAYLAQMMKIQNVKTRGVRQMVNWDDFVLGASATGTFNYKFKGGMNGSILLGIQFEDLHVNGGTLMFGADFDQTNNVRTNILSAQEDEVSASGFLQIKHYFSKKLIFNGGIRDDFKRRIGGKKIHTMSPRMSLIWIPSSVVTIKGGYGHSFVDAPMFYRASNVSIFSGGENLEPEQMDSFQLGSIFNFKSAKLRYELNFFYNNVKDIVFYDPSSSTTGGATLVNAGVLKMGGVENVLQYTTDRFFANLNCTYQYPFAIDNYSSEGNMLSNVPRFLYNTTLQYAVYSGKKGAKIWVRANTHAQSGFNCLTNNLIEKMTDPGKLTYYWQKSYAVINAGLEWQSNFGLDLAFDVNNIGNTKYDVGGQLESGIPGLARNFMFRAKFNL